MSTRKDLTGLKFADWTVLSYSHNEGKIAFYNCKCSCGVEQVVRGYNLKAGRSKSCVKCGQKRTKDSLIGKDKSKYEPKIMTKMRIMREYTYRSKNKKRLFELTFQQFDFLISQNCHYCGIAPSTYVNKTNESSRLQIRQERYDAGWVYYNGIDRVDSEKGYTINNVVTCCETCNKAKLDMTVTEFKTWIQRVFKNFAAPELSGTD